MRGGENNMTDTQLNELKQAVLSNLTDKNVGFIPTESEEEEFGALMAYGHAFVMVNKVFDKFTNNNNA